MAKARVLLADGYTMVVEGLKKLLEPEFEIVGVTSDGRELLQLALQTKPDVVLLALGMPSLNGFAAGQQLKKLLPATKIIAVTMNEDVDTAGAALSEWASGYLMKSSASGAELSRAIVTMMSGKQYVSRQIADRHFQRFIRHPRGLQAQTLTCRQREVLHLLAEGRTKKQFRPAALRVQTASRGGGMKSPAIQSSAAKTFRHIATVNFRIAGNPSKPPASLLGHQHLVRKTHLRCRHSGIVVTDPAWQASAFKGCNANSVLQP